MHGQEWLGGTSFSLAYRGGGAGQSSRNGSAHTLTATANTWRGARSVVAPGMLQNESVKRWLGGLEPAWTLLDSNSFKAPHDPPSPTAGAIRLATDLTGDPIGRVMPSVPAQPA